jgi:hypothetical protein
MRLTLTKKTILIALSSIIIIAGCFILLAYSRTWNKTDFEFRIHINEKLVKESTFGESPTFAIWLEDPQSGITQTVFVTNRAGKGDWEGKSAVPVALPKWFQVNETEKLTKNQILKKIPEQLAITGATPKPGYFSTRVRVTPGSKWICWIEVNLAGDFNDTYKEYDELTKSSDDYKTGQPALLYKTEIEAITGNMAIPEIVGMCLLDSQGKAVIQPMKGITTAKDIFDEISIRVIKPKPRIIERR